MLFVSKNWIHITYHCFFLCKKLGSQRICCVSANFPIWRESHSIYPGDVCGITGCEWLPNFRESKEIQQFTECEFDDYCNYDERFPELHAFELCDERDLGRPWRSGSCWHRAFGSRAASGRCCKGSRALSNAHATPENCFQNCDATKGGAGRRESEQVPMEERFQLTTMRFSGSVLFNIRCGRLGKEL